MKRIVEAEPFLQFLALFERGVLAHHVVDRIAHIAEQRERDQRHGQHDEDRLHETFCMMKVSIEKIRSHCPEKVKAGPSIR